MVVYVHVCAIHMNNHFANVGHVLLLGLVFFRSAVADTSCTLIQADFNGNDILPSNPPATNTARDCCVKCQGNNKCIAFSYADDSGTCYLKSGVKVATRGDRLSGWVNSSCGCDASGPNTPKCWSTPHPCNGPSPSPPAPPGPHPPSPPPTALGMYRCLNDSVGSTFPFCDQRKTNAVRVDSIVSNLTWSEMIAIIQKKGVARLEVPAYDMWAFEALHGVRLWPEKCPFPDTCTTIFPTASTSSRTFNQTLWQQIGRAMGTEGRVIFNLGISPTLSYRGPQVNIQRDPRWGRNSNSPSEDPIVTGMYGKQLVLGTQSPVNGVNLISSQMKHWTAYGVESNRFGFNGNVSVHDMADTYMVPLQIMLEANVSAAMCAYDAINGTPSCANGWMSNTVLRKTWGWHGVIESDCGALGNIYKAHHYANDSIHAAAAAMKGTCDVECDSVYSSSLAQAYTAGLVSIEQLSSAAARMLSHRFALGLFNDPRGSLYFESPFNNASSVHSPSHALIAREAAQQAVVVVQNDGVLPLSTTTKTFAIIGPLANITDVFLGDYRPAACPGVAKAAPEGTACLPTLLQLLRLRSPDSIVTYASGCADPVCANTPNMSAVNAAIADADVIIIAIGEKATDNDHEGNTDGEGTDRKTVGLPGLQQQLVTAALGTKKPLVFLILSGGAVSVDAVKNVSNTAVVYPGFGGETGQNAIIDVLFGDAPASGRLPWTVVPQSWGDATPMNDMSFQAGQGRSYKYLLPSVTPLYEFGAGLSYTTFELKMATTTATKVLELSSVASETCVDVTNTGPRASPVVVIVFAVPTHLDTPPTLVPNQKLVAFDKVHVGSDAMSKVCFSISDADVSFVDDSGASIAYSGAYTLMFFDGVSSASINMSVTTQRVIATIPPVDNPQPPCCMGEQRSCC